MRALNFVHENHGVPVMSAKILPLGETHTLEVMYDTDAKVYVGNCDGLHVTVEGESVEEVLREARSILPDVLELNGYPKRKRLPDFKVKEVDCFSEVLLEM